MSLYLEMTIVGPIFTETDLALEKMEALELTGFTSKAFSSLHCRDIWETTREMVKKGDFTREKLLSHCLNSPRFGLTQAERSIAIDDISKHGVTLNMHLHAEILTNKMLGYELKKFYEDLGEDDSLESLEAIEEKICEIRSKKLTRAHNEKDLACVELIEELSKMESGENVLDQSGCEIWDSVIGGLPRAQLLILAGRPGGGKTSLAEQVIDHSVRKSVPVLYIQRELARSRAVGRLAARKANIPWARVEMRKLRPFEISTLRDEVKAYGKFPLFLAPVSVCNAATITSLVRFHAKAHGIRIVVMDYVQLINVPKGVERRVAIGDVTRSLKLVANETGVTVIAIAQLSREVDRSESKPNLSHLKESGDIEQDADVVLGLWTTENRDGVSRWPVNWTIMKNRNGPQGTLEVMFDGPSMSFLGKTTIKNQS